MKNDSPYIIHSLSEYSRIMQLPQPEHPLISLFDLSCNRSFPDLPGDKLIHDFYSIFLKKNIDGRLGYGRKYYDFSNGVLGFSSPKQVFTINRLINVSEISGWMLLIHPDFIQKYPLIKKMTEYGFFSYEMNEALHLSEKKRPSLSESSEIFVPNTSSLSTHSVRM